MKLNKLLALGASLVMISTCTVLPVSAENTLDFVVVGVSKDNTGYIVRNSQKTDFNIGTNQLEKYNPSIGEVQLGDILTFENLNWDMILDYGGIHPFNELLESADEDTITVSTAGSVFDNPETKTYKVWGFSIDESPNEWNDSVHHFLTCSLADENGHHPFAFFGEPDYYVYTPSDCVDWADLQKGDIVSCIVYDNTPMFVTEKVSDITVKPIPAVIANGDADGNGTLDILDIITVNKAILGKENFDAERIPYIDFNQNQVPDSDDALTMLKMIVGLA